jgi:hypothetical protein
LSRVLKELRHKIGTGDSTGKIRLNIGLLILNGLRHHINSSSLLNNIKVGSVVLYQTAWLLLYSLNCLLLSRLLSGRKLH